MESMKYRENQISSESKYINIERGPQNFDKILKSVVQNHYQQQKKQPNRINDSNGQYQGDNLEAGDSQEAHNNQSYQEYDSEQLMVHQGHQMGRSKNQNFSQQKFDLSAQKEYSPKFRKELNQASKVLPMLNYNSNIMNIQQNKKSSKFSKKIKYKNSIEKRSGIYLKENNQRLEKDGGSDPFEEYQRYQVYGMQGRVDKIDQKIQKFGMNSFNNQGYSPNREFKNNRWKSRINSRNGAKVPKKQRHSTSFNLKNSFELTPNNISDQDIEVALLSYNDFYKSKKSRLGRRFKISQLLSTTKDSNQYKIVKKLQKSKRRIQALRIFKGPEDSNILSSHDFLDPSSSSNQNLSQGLGRRGRRHSKDISIADRLEGSWSRTSKNTKNSRKGLKISSKHLRSGQSPNFSFDSTIQSNNLESIDSEIEGGSMNDSSVCLTPRRQSRNNLRERNSERNLQFLIALKEQKRAQRSNNMNNGQNKTFFQPILQSKKSKTFKQNTVKISVEEIERRRQLKNRNSKTGKRILKEGDPFSFLSSSIYIEGGKRHYNSYWADRLDHLSTIKKDFSEFDTKAGYFDIFKFNQLIKRGHFNVLNEKDTPEFRIKIKNKEYFRLYEQHEYTSECKNRVLDIIKRLKKCKTIDDYQKLKSLFLFQLKVEQDYKNTLHKLKPVVFSSFQQDSKSNKPLSSQQGGEIDINSEIDISLLKEQLSASQNPQNKDQLSSYDTNYKNDHSKILENYIKESLGDIKRRSKSTPPQFKKNRQLKKVIFKQIIEHCKKIFVTQYKISYPYFIFVRNLPNFYNQPQQQYKNPNIFISLNFKIKNSELCPV